MDTLLEAMLNSPILPRQVEKLNRVLAEEQARRKQFYAEMSPGKKMEFINGIAVVHSPARWRHAEASDFLFLLLSSHTKRRGLGRAVHETTLVTLMRCDYQPDVAFFRRETADCFAPDQLQFPAPDFVVEVLSPTTEATDRRIKKRDYAVHGVSEYWLVDPEARTVEQLILHGEDYHCRGIWKCGDTITSAAVTEFSIPIQAIFDVSANVTARATLTV